MRFHLLNIVVLLLRSRTVATNLYKNAALPIAANGNGTYSSIRAPQLSFDIFKGIAFAHTPRFQLPQSLNQAWEISRSATEPSLACVGLNVWLRWSVGEDCLKSNVVRPKGINCRENLPLLVSGSRQSGSNIVYLMGQLNYRRKRSVPG
jgi:carboxylesterase type B